MSLINVLLRLFREHVPFHLLIPLFVGILCEGGYFYFYEDIEFSQLLDHLFSWHSVAVYGGIVLAYALVSLILIERETSLSPEKLHLHALENKLTNAKSVFAIGTLRFNEWFDPTVQLYLAALFKPKLSNKDFVYERVLLLGDRSIEKHLGTAYLDGYYAKCLIGIHQRLNIKLYYLKAQDIFAILDILNKHEKIAIGFYPKITQLIPERFVKFILPLKHRRIRRIAALVIELNDGSKSAFRFSKHKRIVELIEETTNVYDRLIEEMRNKIFDQNHNVDINRDFTQYYTH